MVRAFVKCVVVALMLGGAVTDGSPQQAPAPTFRSGRDILTIDAAVRDSVKGEATFGRNDRLRMWLPVKMTERPEARLATVTASATSGDFKRFETSTSTEFKN